MDLVRHIEKHDGAKAVDNEVGLFAFAVAEGWLMLMLMLMLMLLLLMLMKLLLLWGLCCVLLGLNVQC